MFDSFTVNYIPTITVHNQFAGQHRWKDCPFEDKAFLREWHRHVFQVRSKVVVSHNNRDVEFFKLQDLIEHCLRNWKDRQFEESCESIALAIATYLIRHDMEVVEVAVSEDGENEGAVHFKPSATALRTLVVPVPPTLFSSASSTPPDTVKTEIALSAG